LGIALGEEPGFRGFALPRLLAGRRTAITAALILGVLHAVWHIPVIIQDGTVGIISTVLIVIAGSVINTWMFNHTNGSVLMAMLLHVGIDVASGDVGVLKHLFTGADLERQVIWQTVAFVAFAILLPILAGRELGRKPKASMETMVVEQPLLVE
jgi:membrane protease YdiL (CAAX protease family)